MLGIKVASGITVIVALLCSGYHYIATKTDSITKVLIDEGFEFIENLPKDKKQKIYQDSFARNKGYINATKEYIKGTTYELTGSEDDEEGGIALSYWCREVFNKPVRSNSSHHLIYASKWCTLNFEDKFKSEDKKFKSEDWCNNNRNKIVNKLNQDDYEEAKNKCVDNK